MWSSQEEIMACFQPWGRTVTGPYSLPNCAPWKWGLRGLKRTSTYPHWWHSIFLRHCRHGKYQIAAQGNRSTESTSCSGRAPPAEKRTRRRLSQKTDTTLQKVRELETVRESRKLEREKPLGHWKICKGLQGINLGVSANGPLKMLTSYRLADLKYESTLLFIHLALSSITGGQYFKRSGRDWNNKSTRV